LGRHFDLPRNTGLLTLVLRHGFKKVMKKIKSKDVLASVHRGAGERSLMDGIPPGMAELQRSIRLQKRAARVGFDWASPEPVLEKLQEEIAELLEAMAGGDQDRIEDELGDVLFVLTNLARQLQLDPVEALRHANAKFEWRFRAMEQAAGSRQDLAAMGLGEMEALWQKVKVRFRQQ
jgi:nucleoside triphosphate diphosphatase